MASKTTGRLRTRPAVDTARIRLLGRLRKHLKLGKFLTLWSNLLLKNTRRSWGIKRCGGKNGMGLSRFVCGSPCGRLETFEQ